MFLFYCPHPLSFPLYTPRRQDTKTSKLSPVRKGGGSLLKRLVPCAAPNHSMQDTHPPLPLPPPPTFPSDLYLPRLLLLVWWRPGDAGGALQSIEVALRLPNTLHVLVLVVVPGLYQYQLQRGSIQGHGQKGGVHPVQDIHTHCLPPPPPLLKEAGREEAAPMQTHTCGKGQGGGERDARTTRHAHNTQEEKQKNVPHHKPNKTLTPAGTREAGV